MNHLMTEASRLRTLRENSIYHNNLSAAARAAGISPGTLHKIEGAEYDPPVTLHTRLYELYTNNPRKGETMDQNDICYGLDGDERLKTSIEDVIDDFVCEQNIDDIFDDIAFPIVVHEFRRMKASCSEDWILEVVLNHLDEEYGDPDGNYTEPTEEMKAAAKVFVDAVLSQYLPWVCEPTGKTIEITKSEALNHLGLKEGEE